MKQLQLSIMYCLALLFMGCSQLTHNTSEQVDIRFTSVKKDILSGGGEEGIAEGIIPIRSLQEWKEFLAKANQFNEHISPELSDSVDFKKDMILAVFDQVRSSGGFTFSVQRVEKDGSTIKVHVLSKAPEASSIMILTQPYELIKIPKSDLECILVKD